MTRRTGRVASSPRGWCRDSQVRGCLQVQGIALTLLVLAGCQATHQQAKQQATGRWNTVRAQVKARLAADQLDAGNVADAAGELAEASRLDPTLTKLVPLQARVHLAEGETHKAQQILENATLEGPARAEAEYLLGIAWQHRQRWDVALEHFTRANRQDPDEIAYFVAVVQARLQLGQTEQALDHLRSGQEKFGWTGAYQAAWAECHEQLGDWDAAAAAWSRVLGTNATDPGIRERLAMALYQAARLSEAMPIFEQLVEEDGTDLQALGSEPSDCLRLALADCLLEGGRIDAAHAHVAIVLQRHEGRATAWRLLARVLAAQGRFERALQAAQRALQLDPDNAQSLELAAALASRSGDRQLAVTLATRLLERHHDRGNHVARAILSATAVPTTHNDPALREQ
jgi:tetratricopeptide (TPR) repeat protein